MPDLSFSESVQYAIVGSPEIDHSEPPLLPLEGQASYVGQAGRLYACTAGTGWKADEGTAVLDEYEGTITLTADFTEKTLRGRIGCLGDLVARRAHFGIFLGDEIQDFRFVAAGYELHLGDTPLNSDGTSENTDVMVRHPERTVTQSEGSGLRNGIRTTMTGCHARTRSVSGQCSTLR